MLKWVGINLYLVNRCSLIKYDQLKMLTAINPSLSWWTCIFPHLPSTNHKSTHPYLNAVQKKTLKWRITTTSRSSRRAFTSQLPVEEAVAAVLIQDNDLCVYLSECNKVIYSLLLMFWTLSCDIFTFNVYHTCVNLILAHIWDAFSFVFKTGCDNLLVNYLRIVELLGIR